VTYDSDLTLAKKLTKQTGLDLAVWPEPIAFSMICSQLHGYRYFWPGMTVAWPELRANYHIIQPLGLRELSHESVRFFAHRRPRAARGRSPGPSAALATLYTRQSKRCDLAVQL
jgi:hypothetical protein